MRLIDADKMLKRIESWNTSDAMDKALYNFTLNRIVEQPTIDAVPVRKGKWIRTGRTNIYGGIELQCPFCGDEVMVSQIEDEIYCRHCGAKLREEECG